MTEIDLSQLASDHAACSVDDTADMSRGQIYNKAKALRFYVGTVRRSNLTSVGGDCYCASYFRLVYGHVGSTSFLSLMEYSLRVGLTVPSVSKEFIPRND
jgi:hypothetical protein